MMPSLCGLCQYCYKISRIVKVTNPERCLEILEKKYNLSYSIRTTKNNNKANIYQTFITPA